MSKATPSIDRHNFFILHDRKLDDAFCQAMGLKSYHSKFDEPSNRFCTMICTVKGSSERDLHTLLTRYVEKTPEPRVKLFPFLSAKIFETMLRGGLQPPHPIFEEIMTAKYLHPHLYHEWGSFDTAPTPEPSPKKRAAVDMPEPKKRPAVEMSGGAWPSNLQPAEPARTLALLSTAAPVVCLDSPPETPSAAPRPRRAARCRLRLRSRLRAWFPSALRWSAPERRSRRSRSTATTCCASRTTTFRRFRRRCAPRIRPSLRRPNSWSLWPAEAPRARASDAVLKRARAPCFPSHSCKRFT